MKAIFIDAVNKAVTEVEVEKNGLKDYYRLIGNGCDGICIGATLPNDDTIYVDDEGLLKNLEAGFEFDGRPLMGNGVVVGTDVMGNSIAPRSTLEAIRTQVVFQEPVAILHGMKTDQEVFEASLRRLGFEHDGSRGYTDPATGHFVIMGNPDFDDLIEQEAAK